ncbi:AAA family ATPase [Salinicoccus roseus]|uniref:AAA family ATPase n=1 Tax=Salinicoccus roseus TaxID=45670 RepID=A0A0C2HN08_9STAP|nr:AAA family ATPase [Salinicoccus roseus]KIH70871.1 hypothetical protein SN16_06920 [Salinicoccus roseus]MDB0580529.1 AAA family ATPase [Salinicoccus roseus]
MQFVDINPGVLEELENYEIDFKKEIEFYQNILAEGRLDEVININSSLKDINESLDTAKEVIEMFGVLEKLKNKKYNPLFNRFLTISISNNFHLEPFYYASENFTIAKNKYISNQITIEELKNDIPDGIGAGGGSEYIYHGTLLYLANNLLHKVVVFHSTLKNINLLERISHIENNIVIIGANGSGKSTLARQLNVDEDFNGVNIISSQHYLSITDHPFELDPNGDHFNINSYLSKDKLTRDQGSEDDYIYLNEFNKLINHLLIQHFSFYSDSDKGKNREESILEKVMRLWSNLILKHEMIIKNGVLKVRTANQEEFYFNTLSDGERQIFYFLANSLLSYNSSYLIVDEPENHLNPQISKKLWDEIEKELDDTQIIYITHDSDFASTRDNSTLIWSREYKYPDDWKFDIINDENLPTELMVEVLGSKLNIIFCEGRPGGEDYRVYSSVYKNYKVIPVDGHMNVINYTRALNKFENLHLEVYGIIDGDYKLTETGQYDTKDNIYYIAVNEIEMLTIVDFVMVEALQRYKDNTTNEFKIEDKIKTFEDEFFKKIEERKEAIVLGLVKEKIENIFMNEKLQKYKSIEDINEEIHRVFNMLEPNILKETFKKQIEGYYQDRKYKTLLQYCNLKTEVSIGLTNDVLFKQYNDYAIKVIMDNKGIQKKLLGEYLPKLN